MSWGDAFKAAWNKATDVACDAAGALATGAKKAAGWVKEKASDVADWGKQKYTEIKDKATKTANWVKKKTDEVKEWAKKKASQAESWVKDKAIKFSNMANKAYQAVKKKFGDMVAGATKIICKTANILLGPSKKPTVKHENFLPEKLNSIIGQEIQGENSESLQNAMQTLWDNRYNSSSQNAAVQKALQIVAKERKVPLEKIQDDWKHYQNLLNEQRKTGKANHQDDVPGINCMHSDFMASTSQLRSGKIVGDAFGIDPVFGSLLNPTGGLAGSGNMGLDFNDSAIGYHGAVHDAAGYLKNYHDKGPGYDYLGSDNRDTRSSLSGQRNGIRYWRDQLKTDSTTDLAGETLMRGVVGTADMYSSAKDAASEAWDDIVDFFN